MLFLGAGVSASAVDQDGKRPKSWVQFLLDACTLVKDAEKQTKIKSLIDERRYLLALEAIAIESDAGDYQQFLSREFNNPNFSPSKLHEAILGIDSRIVITTNFDKIYERLCLGSGSEGYKVLPYYSDSLGDELRSDTRIIIKAHGTIDDVKKMVFTKSEYHEAKKNHPDFYTMLRAIFLTNTAIFLGCSLDDPDLLLTLEDVRITASGTRPHYILVLNGANSSWELRDWQKSYNIKAIEYGPAYDDLTTALQDLRNRVATLRSSKPEPT
ncbi:MAG: SIR2 family protein [Rhizobium sp.]|nr:SIR2 family protein [Rhizobium sp.]